LLLVLAVVLAHWALRQGVEQVQADWRESAPPPARLQAAFVRELRPSLPPATPPRSAPPAVPAASPSEGLPLHRHRLGEGMPNEPAPPASAPQERVPLAHVESAASAVLPPALDLSLPATALPAGLGEPGPEWPLSTRLDYRLTGNYNGPLHGTARVEWLRKGAEYQMHLDVEVGILLTRRSSSYGLLTAEGIRPQRYVEETKVPLLAPRRATVQFFEHQVQFADNRIELLLAGAQDQASQFVQLTWLFLTGRKPVMPGVVVDQPLVLARKQYAWRYEVVGEELLQTPLGELPTWHIKPQREAGGGDLTAEVWLAPSVQYLPVRMVLRRDADTWIELQLNRVPLQAEAAPSEAAPPTRSAP
jgi:hypothetical protein